MASMEGVRLTTAPDGVAIAFEGRGSGPPLLYARGWISHLELQRQNPAIERFFAPIRRGRRVYKYDGRGNGLADWDPPVPIGEEDLLADLETIAAQIPEPRFDLWATTYAGPIAVQFAARHPDRLDRLILDGTFARGRHFLNEERAASFFDLLALAPRNPDMVYSSLSFMTDPDPELSHETRVEQVRQSVSPHVIENLYRVAWNFDVQALLGQIEIPTLILHRRNSRAIPVRAAHKLAAALPQATLVLLDGSEHNPYEGDWRSALSVIADFLELELPDDALTTRGGVSGSELLTILFTDIVGSTSMTSAFGDDIAQESVHEHDEVVRRTLHRFKGSEIKHTGDGIMASFRSVSDAADAALAITEGLSLGRGAGRPGVRLGLNAGEPLPEDGDLFGSTVQIAARVCDLAGDGEILVSDVVRQLARGKSLRFVDCGLRSLKGVDDDIRVWSLERRRPAGAG